MPASDLPAGPGARAPSPLPTCPWQSTPRPPQSSPGSGKTTLARLLRGLAEPTGGAIRYRGIDLRRLDRDGRRAFRHDVQDVFQDPYGVYNPFYRVDHVLTTPLRRFRLA